MATPIERLNEAVACQPSWYSAAVDVCKRHGGTDLANLVVNALIAERDELRAKFEQEYPVEAAVVKKFGEAAARTIHSDFLKLLDSE